MSADGDAKVGNTGWDGWLTWTVVASGLLFTAVLIIVLAHVTNGSWEDLKIYQDAAVTVKGGGNPYDSLAPVVRSFLYSPPSLLLFEPVVGLSGWWVVVFSVVVTASGVWVLWNDQRHTRQTLFMWILLCLGNAALAETLWYGQVNAIVFWGICMCFTLVDRNPRVAGSVLGLVAIFKLTPLILIAWLWARGSRRGAIWSVGAFGLAWGLAALRYGPQIIGEYLHKLPVILSTVSVSTYSYSFISRLVLGGLVSNPAPVQGMYVIFIAMLIFLNIGLLKCKRADGDLTFCAVLIALVIVPSIVWYHHLLVVLPALLILGQRNKGWGLWCLCGFLLLDNNVITAFSTDVAASAGMEIMAFCLSTLVIISVLQVRRATVGIYPIPAVLHDNLA